MSYETPFDKSIQHMAEFINDRLYFASTLNGNPIKNVNDLIYFCTDDEFTYTNYNHDFGPLNISCLYKYCCKLMHFFQLFPRKKIIHYTTITNPKKRLNAAFLIGGYSIIYLGLTPQEAYRILSRKAPPFRKYVDASPAGCSKNTIDLIDCFLAVQKAHTFGFFNFCDFDVDSYDKYDTLGYGDLNWILPRKFLAFIGPTDLSSKINEVCYHPATFYIKYFLKNDVRTVIRLNKKMYDQTIFMQFKIAHYDLYFTDGSTPPKDILLRFLHIAENSRGAVAVHCKAGLGRTGSLIGAYLVKHYRLTAKEAIAWIRLCRPGSVIGQQQDWLERMEPWLWCQGNTYRLEQYGDGDRIAHHRYGIYSAKWRKLRAILLKQAAKNKQNEKYDKNHRIKINYISSPPSNCYTTCTDFKSDNSINLNPHLSNSCNFKKGLNSIEDSLYKLNNYKNINETLYHRRASSANSRIMTSKSEQKNLCAPVKLNNNTYKIERKPTFTSFDSDDLEDELKVYFNDQNDFDKYKRYHQKQNNDLKKIYERVHSITNCENLKQNTKARSCIDNTKLYPQYYGENSHVHNAKKITQGDILNETKARRNVHSAGFWLDNFNGKTSTTETTPYSKTLFHKKKTRNV